MATKGGGAAGAAGGCGREWGGIAGLCNNSCRDGFTIQVLALRFAEDAGSAF